MGSSSRTTGGRRRELHRQHQPEPLPLGQVAWVVVARQPGHDAVGQRPAGAGRGARSPGRPARTPRRPSPGRAGRPASAARGRPATALPAGGSAPSTRTVPACAAAGRVQRPQQRRLAGAVPPHHRHDLPGGHARGRRRAARRPRRTARPARARRAPTPGSCGGCRRRPSRDRRRNQGVEALAQRARPAGGRRGPTAARDPSRPGGRAAPPAGASGDAASALGGARAAPSRPRAAPPSRRAARPARGGARPSRR